VILVLSRSRRFSTSTCSLQFAVSLQGSHWLVTRSLDPGLLNDINTNKLEASVLVKRRIAVL
jgi:hypothetical protein